MCPGDSARRAGWQASPGGRGLLMGAAPSERVPDERGPRRAGTCTRPPAFGPWRACPRCAQPRHAGTCVRPHGARTPTCDPRSAALACELASRPVPMLQSLCPKGACRATCAKAHTGRLMRTAQADPRVPRPCEPACVRGRSPGKMLRRCAPERSAMAIYRLDAFSSVQLWQ